MELIKVDCSLGGRQKGKGIFRVPIITFATKRRIFRSWPALSAPDKVWDEWFVEIAKLLPKWEFAGADGEVLPDPEDQPTVFNELTDEELSWVIIDGLFGTPKGSSAS